ncbi:MAG TPA: TrbI/VirB10 family protein [Alphaproteobacteria bacterium]|nr:TrbI/VirB10 family protein [Alphaproteobacteria bacterium]
MTADSGPQAPVRPPADDPLRRHRIVASGPHVTRILLVAAAIVGTGLVVHLMDGGEETPRSTVVSRFEHRPPEPRTPSYADLAAEEEPPSAPPAPRAEPVAMPAPPARAPSEPRRDALWERAMEAGPGGWSRDRREREAPAPGTVTAIADRAGETASQFTPAASSCFVPPGTPIEARTLNRVVTEHGGIITAIVTRDVWDSSFGCLAIPAGSMLTAAYGTDATRGQKRIAISDPTIIRPWPRSDVVAVAAMTADAAGASGLPGRVSVPWFQTGVLIASSTAVDLGLAALTGGGSLIGGILARNIDSPLDQAAKSLLERAPVITLQAGQPILVFLRGGLIADEFRSG